MRLLLAIALLVSPLPLDAYAMAATPLRRAAESSTATPDETPTPTPTPTPDPVLEQAKREAAIADELKKKAVADKERAEAEAERLKALALPLGTPSNVQVPTGSVTTDAAGWVESQMLAHEAARQITARLTTKLCSGQFMPGGVASPLGVPATATAADMGEEPEPQPTHSPQPTPSPSVSVNTLVIHNASDLAGVELYNSVMGQLDQLRKEFVSVNAEAEALLRDTNPKATPTPTPSPGPTTSSAVLTALAAPGIATGIIKSVAELLNLFRTETRFENKSVQISEDMVVSHLVTVLAENTSMTAGTPNGQCDHAIKVYYPALFPAKLVEPSSSSPLVTILNRVERLKNASTLLVERVDARVKELNALGAKREDLDKKMKAKSAKEKELAAKNSTKPKVCRRRNSPECKKLTAEIEELGKEIGELDKAIKELEAGLSPVIKANADATNNFQDWVVRLNQQKSKLQALINSTDLLSSRLNTPDANTRLTALAQLLRAEKLHSILIDPRTFTLRVAVTANGTTKIKKNLFVDAKVRHSAGANLVYQLFNRDGVLAQGAVMQCYIDYRSARDVQRVVSGEQTVVCHSASQ